MIVYAVIREYDDGSSFIVKAFIGPNAKNTADAFAQKLDKGCCSTSNTYGDVIHYSHEVEEVETEECL